MCGDKDRMRDKGGRSFVITHNVRGGLDRWAEQFKQNEKYRLRKRRKKDGVFFNHEILSWHSDDLKKISLEKLRDMAHEYIRLRNKNGMYVIVPHFDREHIHLHICSSALEYRTGKNMRMSRKELADLKKKIQQYQIEKYPELEKSVVNYGRKSRERVSDNEVQYKRRTGKRTKKEELRAIVDDCHKRAQTAADFFARLKGQNLQTYVRGGKVYGVVHENRRYRFKRLGINYSDLIPNNHRTQELKTIRSRQKRKGRER